MSNQAERPVVTVRPRGLPQPFLVVASMVGTFAALVVAWGLVHAEVAVDGAWVMLLVASVALGLLSVLWRGRARHLHLHGDFVEVRIDARWGRPAKAAWLPRQHLRVENRAWGGLRLCHTDGATVHLSPTRVQQVEAQRVAGAVQAGHLDATGEASQADLADGLSVQRSAELVRAQLDQRPTDTAGAALLLATGVWTAGALLARFQGASAALVLGSAAVVPLGVALAIWLLQRRREATLEVRPGELVVEGAIGWFGRRQRRVLPLDGLRLGPASPRRIAIPGLSALRLESGGRRVDLHGLVAPEGSLRHLCAVVGEVQAQARDRLGACDDEVPPEMRRLRQRQREPQR